MVVGKGERVEKEERVRKGGKKRNTAKSRSAEGVKSHPTFEVAVCSSHLSVTTSVTTGFTISFHHHTSPPHQTSPQPLKLLIKTDTVQL